MKRFLLIIAIFSFFTACKKSETDVNPQDPGATLSGTYKLESLTLKSPSDNIDIELSGLPKTVNNQKVSGTVDVKKGSSNTMVDITLNLVVDGKTSSMPLGDLEVRTSSKGQAASLYYDNTLCGDISSSAIIFNLTEGNEKIAFAAKK